MNRKQELVEQINKFNYNNITYKIESQVRLLKYSRILTICIHIINSLSIILSVLSETIQDKIIYAVIVCNICNSVINYEIMKCHKSIQSNTILINQFMKNETNEMYMPTEMYSTPAPTPVY